MCAAVWVLAGACGLASVMGACAIDPGPTAIRVDGDVGEWPRGHRAVADDHYLYLRFEPPGEQRTLQASGTPTRILIDADDDGETGLRAHGVGAELEIVLSPEGKGHGAAVRTFDGAGDGTDVSHHDVDFHFAPAYAAGVYEARIARDAWAMGDLGSAGGVVRGVVAFGSGEHAPVSRFEASVRAPMGPAPALVQVPGVADGCLRVMSWNVLRGSPGQEPAAFGRVIAALDPDIVLVQEWDDIDSAAMAAWFNEHAPASTGTWSAAALPDSGVGVVTRHALIEGPGGPVAVEGEWPARCVGAVVRTPLGEIVCASVHLKCCGSAGSKEDLRREREVRAIGGALPAMFPEATPDTVIVGGDMNLVGSRPTIDLLARGIDVDGSDAALAEARVLGDGSAYTWTDAKSSFTPGRLDWVVVGDARAAIERAFVVDAARLGDAALEAAGIERGDTNVSDHLPVVVDVRITR
ncbi:MAG: endonuclease [Phycisphaeraceae bacterium]|nr:MAG: endonuclease [Phycisphaeraceae bacterium]